MVSEITPSIVTALNKILVQPKAQLTFLDNAIQDGVLQEELFTIDLKKGEPGSYEFGFIDSSKYLGDITYTSVDSSSGFWNITSTGFGIGDGKFQSESYAGIIDTGTSLLVMDDNFVSTYWRSIPGAGYDAGQGGYTFPCSTPLLDIQIGIESYMAIVPGSYLNFAPVDNTSKSKESRAYVLGFADSCL